MKSKNLLSIALFVALPLVVCVMAGCKKEGKLNTKQKIDKVFREESMMMGGEMLYHDAESLSEEWCWDGKELYRIDYYVNHQCSENFFYDGKQIVRTTVPAYGIENRLHYDGRELERIESYIDGELDYTILFSHDDGKISEMRWIYSTSETSENNNNPLLDKMFGGELVVAITANNEMLRKRSGRKDDSEIVYHFEWKDGNVKKVTCGDWQAEMTYDDNYNPYHNLFGENELNDPLFGFEMMSENNIRTITMPFKTYGTIVFTYTYEYEDDFPKRRTLNYSYSAPGISSYEMTSYELTRVEKFIYE